MKALKFYKQFIAILTPIIFLPLVVTPTANQVSRCGYVVVVMAVFWCLDLIPLAVTALLPVALLPLLGVLSTNQVCAKYIKDTSMMLLGGLILAIGVEKVNLHKRIALNILLFFGAKTHNLILGFAVTSWFLSMWISNVATMTLMLPILEAILIEMEASNLLCPKKHNTCSIDPRQKETELNNSRVNLFTVVPITSIASNRAEVNGDGHEVKFCLSNPEKPQDSQKGLEKTKIYYDNVAKALTLSITYAAKCGGMATLTGTPPNMILKSQVDELWSSRGVRRGPLSFASWMVYSLPVSVLILTFVILWLQVFYLGIRSIGCYKEKTKKDNSVRKIIKDKLEELGRVRYAEVVTLVLFVLLVLCWFFIDPGFIRGWADLFPAGYVDASVPSIFISTWLFIIPLKNPFRKHPDSNPSVPILDWRTVQQKMPWLVLFVIGGGNVLAHATLVSGLSAWLGEQLLFFAVLPSWLMLACVCLLVALLTEVITNTAATTLLLPVMASLADSLGLHPLYLMFPVTIATEFAFMLPTSASSTALALTTGRVVILDMVKVGIVLNLVGTAIITLASTTWGYAYFNLGVNPLLPPTNSTLG